MAESIVLSHGEVGHIRGMLSRLREKHAKAVEHGERIVGQAARSIGVSSFAFLTGVAQTRWESADGTPGTEVHGVPLDLLGGLGLNVAGFFKLGGKFNEALHAAGDGVLAAFSSSFGRGVGRKWKSKSAQGSLSDRAKVAGLPGDRLTDAEIADLRARAKQHSGS